MISPSSEVLDIIPDPTVLVDRHGHILDANRLAQDFFGYAPVELRGQLVEVLLPGSLGESHAQQRATFGDQPHTRPMGSGLELVARHRDGRLLPVEISLSPIDTSDGLQIIAVIRDISDRRRIEGAFKMFSRSAGTDAADTFFPNILRELGQALGVAYAFLVEPGDNATARVTNAFSANDDGLPPSLSLAGTPWQDLLDRGQLMYVPDGAAGLYPGSTLLTRLGIASYAGISLQSASGRILGGLVVMDRKPIQSHSVIKPLFETLAVRLASELERRQLRNAHDEASRQADLATSELAAMYVAATQINRSLDLKTTLENILEAAVHLVGCTIGVALPTPDGTQVRYDAVRGPEAATLAGLASHLGEGGTGIAAQTGEVLNVPDVLSNPRWRPGPLTRIEKVRSAVIIPLKHDGRIVGVLSAVSDTVAFFTPDRERLLRNLAEHAAVAVAHAREVADRLQVQQQLRAQALILENVRESIVVTDLSGAITYWNAGATALYGYDAEEMLGRLPLVLYPSLETSRITDAIAQLTAGNTIREEIQLIQKSGDPVWVSSLRTPLRDRDGQVAGFVSVSRDITERKTWEEALRRSEQLFRSLIEFSADIVAILEGDGTIRYVSPSIQRVLGYAESDLIGRHYVDIVRSTDRTAARQLRKGLKARSIVTGSVRVRIRASDGSWRTLDAVVLNLLEEPVIGGVLATLRDVTEQLRADERLQQTHRLEAIGQLAGGVAHDFNNLLMVINGSAEVALAATPPGGMVHDALTQIASAGASAANLTHQLLAFSRRQVSAPREIDLNRTIDSTVGMLRRLVGEEIKLVVGMTPRLGLTRADPGQIEQVVVNLVVNARDAMPYGGELRIETANVNLGEADARYLPGARPGPHVLLVVSDTGVGMSPEVQARAFEPFFTTKEVGKGTGLGLAAVYGIVQQSGGSIKLSSAVGRGTTIEIYLPRIDTPAADNKPSSSAEPDLARGVETVLLVEDDARVRRLARDFLQGLGYVVLEAESGEAAIALARKHAGRIDLVLTDVVMPGITGSDVADRLRRLDPEVKVIYMSGYTTDRVVRGGVREQDVAFLQKPFTRATLAQKVRDVLDRADAENASG